MTPVLAVCSFKPRQGQPPRIRTARNSEATPDMATAHIHRLQFRQYPSNTTISL
ncbi:hypothetical protein FH972_021840 [Carpinus fangiana]|uniref:Uncharacterized protein n=1 Tax=Carpinus fangiana TaxID=176857 RepID=A0A5N6KQV1_9ROSI|nr:hypothetical protein FH972_021840 [Carpinus fangiana]